MALIFTDSLKKDISLDDYPGRIVSLCPSVTETLIKIGLRDSLVGRTNYCYRPEGEVENIDKVGGPKGVNFESVENANPDLIIAVKEENDRNQIEKLRESYPVYVFDINNYSDALDMIIQLGELTGKQGHTVELVDKIDKKFAGIPDLKSRKTFLFLIWKDPFMAAGKRTYINNILTSHGFVNCLDQFIQRYVTLNLEVFKKLNFDIAFLPTEPYNFDEEDKKDILAFFPEAEVKLVDGEIFTWYGYRMLDAADYLKKLIEELG